MVEVSDIADASSGVASYSVVVEFNDESGDFYVGTTVIAEITVANRTGVLLVPSAAVATENGQSTVQVALDGTADGRVKTRAVTTGETSGNQIEITSGLAAGDQILVELPGFAGVPGGGFQPPDGLPAGGGSPPAGFPAARSRAAARRRTDQPTEECNP